MSSQNPLFGGWIGEPRGPGPYGLSEAPKPEDEAAWLDGRLRALQDLEFFLDRMSLYDYRRRIREDQCLVSQRLEILKGNK